MLYSLNEIKLLIKAGYVIQLSKYKSPLLVSDHDLFEPQYYIDPKDEAKHWLIRPVVLREEEYKNPYLVFEMIFKEQDYKSLYRQFKELFHAACKTNPLQDMEINTFELYVKMFKIIEACYLINVREIYHHNGRLK